MSGYFVHGGTQYPYGQNPPQQVSAGNVQQQQQQSYYGDTSYPSNQSGGFDSSNSNYSGQASADYTYSSSTGDSTGNYGSSQSYGAQNNQYGNTASAGSNNSYGSGFNSATSNYSGTADSYGSEQTSHSSYEKKLQAAANTYYANASKGNYRGRGRGGRGSFGSRGRGRGGRPSFSQPQKQSTGPKPIKATEIKAFLYAWCGQRKLKPEYEVTTEGQPPKKVTFTCKLHVSGLDYIAEAQAVCKKDAQSKAAWDLCENLARLGYMKVTDLPPKPVEKPPKSSTGERNEAVGSLPAETAEEINQKGGWTLTNSRQRLNQFCQRERITPMFQHSTVGPEQSRVFVCSLNIVVSSVQKEFSATERGNNKKQATSICALAVVRQLFEADLIERCGDPIKHVTKGGLLTEKQAGNERTTAVTAGQKRKAGDKLAPDFIDENGNWTAENSRQRLNQFCQANNLTCDVMYEEEGQAGSKTYTASLNLKVKPTDSEEEKEITGSAKGQSKKLAAQGCALQLMAQLYKLSLVEANPNISSVPSKKKQNKQKMDVSAAPFTDFSDNYTVGTVFGRPPMTRRTPQLDLHIAEKHKLIYPDESELAVIQRSVRRVEEALKEVSDQLVETDGGVKVEKDAAKEESQAEAAKKRKLQSVLRVGSLSKGLLMKGDRHVHLVLLCQEAPTAKLLLKVAQLLPKHIKASDGDNFKVETAMQEAAINITNKTAKTEKEPSFTCTITVTLTSPVVRTPKEEAAKDPPGSLNKDKCLQALAELRHAKWFQACASGVPSCVMVIRIFREMRRRLLEWKPLSDWAIELITEKALVTSPAPLSLGSSFLRCMEAISSGILLPGGSGVADPCERTEVDATAKLTKQEREAITTAAQDAMRLIVFRQPHKVLGIDAIEYVHPAKKAAAVAAATAGGEEAVKMETS